VKIPKCNQQNTLKELKKKDVFYLKADKSDRTDYVQRMLDLISDGPYEEINFNPLDKMIRAVKITLNTVKLKFNIELEGKWMVSNPKVPHIYGAPKTQKQKRYTKSTKYIQPIQILSQRLIKRSQIHCDLYL
jgi:hypothetical protein